MIIEVTDQRQIDIVASLAKKIWTECYTPIIGRDQVEYMLGTFQSKDAISVQIHTEGCRYFLIEEDGAYVGYLGVQSKDKELFLSKICIEAFRRGKGIGRKSVQFLEHLASLRNLNKISLTVNKNNLQSIKAYEKMGFTNLGSVVQDIGNGFIMDDFKMEKIVF